MSQELLNVSEYLHDRDSRITPPSPITYRRLVTILSQRQEACRRAKGHGRDGFRQLIAMYKALLPFEDVVDDDIVARDIHDGGLIRKRDGIRVATLYPKNKSVR